MFSVKCYNCSWHSYKYRQTNYLHHFTGNLDIWKFNSQQNYLFWISFQECYKCQSNGVSTLLLLSERKKQFGHHAKVSHSVIKKMENFC